MIFIAFTRACQPEVNQILTVTIGAAKGTMATAIRIRKVVITGLILAGAAFLGFTGTAAATLEQTGRWGGESFTASGDLAAGPGGTIGVYDPKLGQALIFTAQGQLIRSINGPTGFRGEEDTVSLDLRDDGSIELFDRVTQRLYRFDDQGQPTGQVDFGMPGNVREFSPDPRGGYIAAFGDDLMVARFGDTGEEIVTWPTGRLLEGQDYGGVKVEIDLDYEDDRVMVQSGNLIGAFSRSGEPWANWSLRDSECRATVAGFRDLALDQDENLYALGSHSAPGPKAVLYKFDETLNVIWREELDRAFSTVAVGTDGSIYLAGEAGNPAAALFRFSHLDDPQAPLWGRCPEPKPIPQPPAKPKLKLLRVAYGPGRTWARARLYASGPGVIRVSGRKIRPVRIRVGKAGRYWVAVKPRRRFTAPARPRRKLRLRAVFTFRSPQGNLRRATVVKLRGKTSEAVKESRQARNGAG